MVSSHVLWILILKGSPAVVFTLVTSRGSQYMYIWHWKFELASTQVGKG